jgi:CheY-like chemotaxis protein
MRGKTAAKTATPAPSEGHKKKSILLVDEDAPLRLVLGRLLENEGYAVTTCRNEVQAIALIESRSFDFPITDHSSSGVEAQFLVKPRSPALRNDCKER